jgi:hypothetical protein
VVHLLETFIRNLIEDARYRKPQIAKGLELPFYLLPAVLKIAVQHNSNQLTHKATHQRRRSQPRSHRPYTITKRYDRNKTNPQQQPTTEGSPKGRENPTAINLHTDKPQQNSQYVLIINSLGYRKLVNDWDLNS